MNKFLLLIVSLLVLSVSVSAQEVIQKSESSKVYFRQGSSTLDPKFLNNRESLDSLAKLLEPYVVENTKTKGRVHIKSSASPEGGSLFNQKLIENRAKRIADWIGNRFKVEIGYELEHMGIDWTTLIELVEKSATCPSKAQVLDILRNTPPDQRQVKLEALEDGKVMQWLLLYVYPKLRYAAVDTQIWYASEITITTPSPMYFPAEGGDGTINFTKNVEDKVAPTVTCDVPWITDIVATPNNITFKVQPNAAQDPRKGTIQVQCYGKTYPVEVHQAAAEPEPVVEVVEEPVVEEKPECTRPFYMSVSTNGLYDLALIPNIGVEFYLGNKWSIDGNWHYAWWKTDKHHRYWRTYGGDLNIRKWFGKKAEEKPLTGHHLGVYGQMITYDFELGGRGYLAPKWSWATGVEYGYSLPIARRLNLDFSIGIGYHWGKYYEYLPIDNCYVWQETNQRKYFGPTKAEVSIVWLLGCGNYNKDKGGKK